MTGSSHLIHHRFPFQVLLLSFLALLSTQCQGLSPNILYEGLMCSDHPAAQPSWQPVLVRSWVLDRLAASDFETEMYIAQYTNHTYAPVSDRTSSKYFGLDLFFTAWKPRNPNIRMYFQRDVKVYMVVAVSRREYDPTKVASLLGWQSEGWALRTRGNYKIVYGVHVKRSRPFAKFVYVFSKFSVDKKIDIPQTRFVQARIDGIRVAGAFNLLIAERDGSRSPPVGTFNGVNVVQNEQCPDELHDTWYTQDNNPDDTHTAGMKFSTWHPNWDPCHWCAYDHDHGSSPKHIFGYEPKFNYVALKNNNEDEPHRGFKGFVFETQEHFVYYNLHVRTSSLRRVKGRFHTVHLVIASKETKEILVDIAHKGDFGFQSVRLKPGSRFLPISETDMMIRASQTTVRNFRSIPVINVENLVPEYMYRNPVLLGSYEEWQTRLMCTSALSPRHTFRAIFKQPAAGIKSVEEPDTPVDLGISVRGQFVKSSSLVRSLILTGIEVSDTHCPDRRNGVFYTDAFGVPTSGPGATSLRQLVQPGFRVTLNGRYEPEEVWVGIHGKDKRGFFVDHGYGINPNLN